MTVEDEVVAESDVTDEGGSFLADEVGSFLASLLMPVDSGALLEATEGAFSADVDEGGRFFEGKELVVGDGESADAAPDGIGVFGESGESGES